MPQEDSTLRKLAILKVHLQEVDEQTIAWILTQVCRDELDRITQQVRRQQGHGPMQSFGAGQIGSAWREILHKRQWIESSVRRLHPASREVQDLRSWLRKRVDLNAQRPRETGTGSRGARRTLPPRQEPQYDESDRRRRDEVRELFSSHRPHPMPLREPQAVESPSRTRLGTSTETLPTYDTQLPPLYESPERPPPY